MGMGETAELVADLSLKGNFNKQMKTAQTSTAKLERNIDKITKRTGAFTGFVNRNLSRAVDTLGVRLVGSIGTGLEEMATLEDAATSVTGAIKQVGKGWTTTADDIIESANRIESATDAAFDDKAIVAATETLIRYGKVSEKNLEPAMEVMVDLAARTGDVDSASSLLAKALADPAKAAGKLARAGVILTKEQQKQIKTMVKAGKTAEAQEFLLGELAKTTKGAAAASAGPYRDALNKLGDAGEDLRRGFVTGLAPAILEVTDLLTDELAKPSTMQALKDVGKELGGALKGIIAIAKTLPWDSIGNAMKLAGTGAKAILDTFLGLPPWVQTAVLTGWGLNKITGGAVTDIFGKLLGKGIDIFAGRGSSPANPLFVTGTGVGGPGGVGGGGKGGRFGRFGGAVTIAAGTIAVIGFERALAIWEETNSRSTEQANTAQQNLNNMLAQDATLSDMLIAQRATRDGIKDIRANPLLTLVQGEALNTLNSMDAQLTKAIEEKARPVIDKRAPVNAALNQASIATREGGGKTTPAELKAIRDKIATGNVALSGIKTGIAEAGASQRTEISNVKNAVATQGEQQQAILRAQIVGQAAGQVLDGIHAAGQAIRDATMNQAVRTGAMNTQSAVRGVAPPIQGTLSAGFASLRATIWAARPVIQSTNVVNNYTTKQRTGDTSGSRNGGARRP